MHTHFGSATAAGAAFLPVVIVGTLWRLVGLHLMKQQKSRFFRGIGRGMMFQY